MENTTATINFVQEDFLFFFKIVVYFICAAAFDFLLAISIIFIENLILYVIDRRSIFWQVKPFDIYNVFNIFNYIALLIIVIVEIGMFCLQYNISLTTFAQLLGFFTVALGFAIQEPINIFFKRVSLRNQFHEEKRYKIYFNDASSVYTVIFGTLKTIGSKFITLRAVSTEKKNKEKTDVEEMVLPHSTLSNVIIEVVT